jgi:ADP-ribosyl-[dinitrogen reductase] hydrolase
MSGRRDQLAGLLLGTAVGDALGLPREGLSPGRARALFGDPPLRHRLVIGRGMVSDDTEHACLVGTALLREPADPARFARALAWGLRLWLLGLPAGVGFATLRATLKLWIGFGPEHSGVFSAGNGPAMRAALLGVCLGHDPERLRAFVRASTRLTHTDPRAERGALLVALAAQHGAEHGPTGVNADVFLNGVRQLPGLIDEELGPLLTKVEDHLRRGAPAAELVAALGSHRGITGYVYHTVPVALYCWLRSPGDFRRAVEEVIALGGDADTTGAIVGALAGATLGEAGIPAEWLAGLAEWPRCSVTWLRELARRLSVRFFPEPGEAALGPPPFCWPGLLPRNLFFLLVVLAHGFRRLLPPYG